jgi:hypothetical protein
MNCSLSKSEQDKLASTYSNNDKASLTNPYEKKTIKHELEENHFKFIHIALIAGITYILLIKHQKNEGPLTIFSG